MLGPCFKDSETWDGEGFLVDYSVGDDEGESDLWTLFGSTASMYLP